jgi:acyl-CoA dehydrogenase
MDFTFDDRTKDLQERLTSFMEEKVYPAEQVFADQHAALEDRWAWSEVPVLKELQREARARGLWNLFLPAEHGGELTNTQYAGLEQQPNGQWR